VNFQKLKDTLKIDPYLVAAIIDSRLDIRGNRETAFFRKVLSGVLDPDKLDYLTGKNTLRHPLRHSRHIVHYPETCDIRKRAGCG